MPQVQMSTCSWTRRPIVEKVNAEIEALRAKLADARGMISAHEKARDLMNKGFESTCDLQSELKQEVRTLRAERDRLEIYAEIERRRVDTYAEIWRVANDERNRLKATIDEIRRDEQDGIPTRSATYVHALNTIIELTKDRDRYRDIAGRLAEAGRECISSVQEIDSRLDYVDCQLDRKDWQDMQAALAEYEAMESKWTVTQVNPIDGPAVEKEAKIP